jgi:hypothetical protein
MTEILGYVASFLVVLALTLRSIVRLRMMSLLGAACFLTYGLMIGAKPVVVMNSCIIAINAYHLSKLWRTQKAFQTIEVRPNDASLHAFLSYYRDDLARFFPLSVLGDFPEKGRAFLILRAAAPVGVVLVEPEDARTLFVTVDYVIPDYRDLKPGRHFYEQYAPRLAADGINRLTAARGNDAHADYLRAMGFLPQPPSNGEARYERAIATKS